MPGCFDVGGFCGIDLAVDITVVVVAVCFNVVVIVVVDFATFNRMTATKTEKSCTIFLLNLLVKEKGTTDFTFVETKHRSHPAGTF